jgi:uncharacterized phage protein (TIGR01671 family)
MREIKFRAWYKNKMCFDIEKHHVEHHSISGWSGDVWDFSDWLKYSKVTQYTGLKDKNGKEIYEGDILERIGSSGTFSKIVVSWNDRGCCYVYNSINNIHGEPNPLHDNFVNLCDWTYWVVCGNIFENPELIKIEI